MRVRQQAPGAAKICGSADCGQSFRFCSSGSGEELTGDTDSNAQMETYNWFQECFVVQHLIEAKPNWRWCQVLQSMISQVHLCLNVKGHLAIYIIASLRANHIALVGSQGYYPASAALLCAALRFGATLRRPLYEASLPLHCAPCRIQKEQDRRRRRCTVRRRCTGRTASRTATRVTSQLAASGAAARLAAAARQRGCCSLDHVPSGRRPPRRLVLPRAPNHLRAAQLQTCSGCRSERPLLGADVGVCWPSLKDSRSVTGGRAQAAVRAVCAVDQAACRWSLPRAVERLCGART